MTATDVPVQYFGQLERSPDGFPLGRAVPRQSSDQQGTGREQVRSRRRGRRRLIDLALTAAEPFPDGLDRRTSCAWIRGLARSVVGVNRKETVREME